MLRETIGETIGGASEETYRIVSNDVTSEMLMRLVVIAGYAIDRSTNARWMIDRLMIGCSKIDR
jgi:hypothetical protein